ncbi:MAG: LysM peptidoglycan-binding domain-containing protein [Thermodesulfobacteriota bacterium]
MRKLKVICLIVAVFMVSFCFILSPLAQEKKEAEGIYTIKQGDTLWDISAKFLKDPFLWPKLWQRNPYITNPHWIYPGQPVRLSPFEEIKKEEPEKVVVEEKPKEVEEVVKEVEVKEVQKVEPPPVEKKPEVVPEKKPVEEKPMTFPEIRSAGFINDIDYKGIGIILENREGKNLMAEGDIVYLAFKTSEPILIGNKYTIFRASEMIRHPVTDKKIGRKYNITGNVQIIDRYSNFFTAKIIEAFDAIYKGDMIQPYSKEKMEGAGRE